MVKPVDFSDDILAYLRERRGKPIGPFQMVTDLTKRVKERDKLRVLRGALLSNLSTLISERKVIRYRKGKDIRRKTRSTQGLVRISERYA